MTDWNTKRRKDGRRISELRAERNEMCEVEKRKKRGNEG